MSYTEFHFGKLKIVPKLENETIEEQCKRISKKSELPNPKYYETWEEYFRENFYKDYIIVSGTMYKIYDHFNTDDDSYFFKILPNNEDSYTFVGCFYNGGTCLEECIEEELTKLNL